MVQHLIGGHLCTVELRIDANSDRHPFRVRTVDGRLWCSGTIGSGGASLSLSAFGVAPDCAARAQLHHALDCALTRMAA